MTGTLRFLLIFILVTPSVFRLAHAQTQPTRRKNNTQDTTVRLDSVTIRDNRSKYLPNIQGTFIFAGKKTYSLTPDAGKASLSSSNIRQIFATIPGVNVWELSGNGFQMNIGARGTDTHRSNETNVRQNGYITNSDIFGYPEDHYTPQYDAVEQIQIVRGAAALQFGSQFGGMVNYKIKEGDTSKVIGVQSEQSAGSNKYFNSFNAVGGKSGKWSYYAYFASRTGNGWRKDADFSGQWYYANLKYQFNSKGSIALQFSRVNFFERDAGGLTDAQFKADPQQATRTRNYFDPEINIPALLFNYQLANRTKLEVESHGIIGQRNSIQFLNSPNVADTVNKKLNTFNPRQVDRDYYYGFTTEARLLTRYQIGNLNSALTSGLRYFTERTNRKQKAIGTAGSDYDLAVIVPYGIDLQLRSHNYAAFAENLFQVTPKLSLTPGFRYEIINTYFNGVINNAKSHVSYENNRHFPLLGAGLQYQLTNSSQFYGNISQAYKPFTYANIIPGNDLAVVDPGLRDSRGYNIDLGYRGDIGDVFNYDFNLYYVYYGDRIGNLTEINASNQTYIYTTNIGNAVAKGVELYTQVSLWRAFNPDVMPDMRIFNSFSYNHARYLNGSLGSGNINISLTGNYLEGAPEYINRTGLTYLNNHISSTLQFSYVSKYYTDANNTVFNSTGLSGIVPAYHVFDWSFNYSFLKNYHIFGSINNVLNAKYFTRRITILPGPGILPSDGRTFNIGFGMKI